jgi:mannose-6-phosphate isomerase-like protein (cupin superfamily)
LQLPILADRKGCVHSYCFLLIFKLKKMNIDSKSSKQEIFDQVRNWLESQNFNIIQEDQSRPWGGFFVLDESQILKFRDCFFSGIQFSASQLQNKLSPKILLVGPNKRLSWQYHHRRAEIWKLIGGEGGIITSSTDEEGPMQNLKVGEIIELAQGERHRLIGLGNWGVVAEIWMHTDTSHPSDEEDIVRVQDDFKRK